MTFTLSSPEFDDGAPIPRRHTCEGDDLSPPLSWEGAPEETRSFALLCDDPDAPAGTWHHWALYDLPADRRSLPEGIPTAAEASGARQASNDFRRLGYGGPCPPRGHGTHHYHFRLLALAVSRLELGVSPTCQEVAAAAAPHRLSEVRLIGTYAR